MQIGGRRDRLGMGMGVVRADNVETEFPCLTNRREMVGWVDLVAPQRLSGVVSCRKRDRDQVGRAEEEPATLLGSRRHGVALHCIDRVSRDLQRLPPHLRYLRYL